MGPYNFIILLVPWKGPKKQYNFDSIYNRGI